MTLFENKGVDLGGLFTQMNYILNNEKTCGFIFKLQTKSDEK
jgi:hypothetical protein